MWISPIPTCQNFGVESVQVDPANSAILYAQFPLQESGIHDYGHLNGIIPGQTVPVALRGESPPHQQYRMLYIYDHAFEEMAWASGNR